MEDDMTENTETQVDTQVEEKPRRVNFALENDRVELRVDMNNDNEPCMTARLFLAEAIKEALMRKNSMPIEGAKVVNFELAFPYIRLTINTDRDSTNLLELEINLMEAMQEFKLTS